MLSGVKFISRDKIEKGDERKLSSSKKEKSRRKEGSDYGSSDDEGTEKIRKGSRKKKWYSSEEYSDSSSSDGLGDGSSGGEGKRCKSRKYKGKRRHDDESGSRRSSKRSKHEYSSSASESDEDGRRGRRKGRSKGKGKDRTGDESDVSDIGCEVDYLDLKLLSATSVTRVNKESRAAGILENFAEGEKYAEHSLRKFVRSKSPEIMPSLNRFFSDPQ